MPDQEWPRRLVIVRDGESEKNVVRANAHLKGHDEYPVDVREADVQLTERGRRQAIETGKALQPLGPFYRASVSPYLRTMQTAELILQGLDPAPPLRTDERIREREMGTLDGLTASGVAKHFPAEYERMQREGRYYYRPPAGESYPDVALRVHSYLNSMRQNYAGENVLVVAHAVVIWVFRKVIERLSEQQLISMMAPGQEIKNCAVLQYDFDAATGRLQMRVANQVFYQDEMVTAKGE